MVALVNSSQPKFKFQPGQIVATPGAQDFMEEHGINPMDLLKRHLSGDYGDLCDSDKKENEKGCADNDCPGGDPDNRLRQMSSYNYGDEKIWIITEFDRSCTTFLLPEEY